MAKKQTRRTVSLNGQTYARLRAHAGARGQSMSDVVEQLVAPVLRSTPPPRGDEPTPAVVVVAERGGGVKLW